MNLTLKPYHTSARWASLLLLPIFAASSAAYAQTQTPSGSPQPRITPQQVEQAFRNAKNYKVKKSPKIRNTRVLLDPEIAATQAQLQQLKAGGLKIAGHPGTGIGQPGEGSTSSGGTSPSGSAPAAMVPPNRGTSGSRASIATARAPISTAATPPPPQPNTNKLAVMPPSMQVSNSVACSTKMLMIQSINGVKTGISNSNIIFTPDPQFNDYKIAGCNFGTTQGRAHLNGPFRAGQMALQIEFWSDSMIEVKVDPNVSAEKDLNNVALVLAPASGAQVQLQNCRFYALRKDVVLSKVLPNMVTLAHVMNTGGSPVESVKLTSPYTNTNVLPNSLSNMAGGVDRYDTYRFSPGTDVWDFSNLAPGFVPVDFSLTHWALEQCNGMSILVEDQTTYDDGQWSAQWDPANPKRLIVNFAEQHCHLDSSDASNSSYALEVTVNGPAGVQPIQ
jgi:hypothetical protein